MAHPAETELTDEARRGYEDVVRECLDREADALRVVAVPSATPRGTTLRLERQDGSNVALAFKFVERRSADEENYPFAMVANEAVVLPQLQEYTRNLFVAGGVEDRRAWVMTHWRSGSSAAQEARRLRTAQATPRELLAVILPVFEAVATLHEAGWTHGDLQPAHFLYLAGEESRWNLIDFGLARRQGEDSIPYRGALFHFAAPEVAEGQRVDAKEIAYDALAEQYSLGAVAFHLYTGMTPTDYGDDSASFEDRLGYIAAGENRRTFASVGVAPFPELEAVLDRCLSHDRQGRYSSVREAWSDLARCSHRIAA